MVILDVNWILRLTSNLRLVTAIPDSVHEESEHPTVCVGQTDGTEEPNAGNYWRTEGASCVLHHRSGSARRRGNEEL